MRRGGIQGFVVPIFSFVCGLLFSSILYTKDFNENETSPIRKDPPLSDSATLVVFIVSAPGNLEKRAAIRETWLSRTNSEIDGHFVIGVQGISSLVKETLENEMEDFEDLVLLDIQDSYKLLTDKVVRMIEYADEHFRAKLFMKCDDDTFVNTYLLEKEISKRSYQEGNIYWGFFDGRAPVLKKGKWSEVSYNLCDRYIPYALGGGYIIGWELLKHIARSGPMLKRFMNEDVSLGTWLAGTNVRRIHDERFDTEWRSRGCSNDFLVTQNRSPQQMQEMWSRVSSGKQLCNKEIETRKSYSYNWEVPPSQCCERDVTKK